MSQSSDNLIAMREQNIGRLFHQSARAYSERALALLHKKGFTDITLFHTALISNLDVNGDQITYIAEKAGMSKQAMGQLVNDLEKKGYVKKTKCPNDKRAYLIQFTEHGQNALQAAYDVKITIEKEYEVFLGIENLKKIRKLLEALLSHS
jgi:DNA-binding MarR family transcriptional regulator